MVKVMSIKRRSDRCIKERIRKSGLYEADEMDREVDLALGKAGVERPEFEPFQTLHILCP